MDDGEVVQLLSQRLDLFDRQLYAQSISFDQLRATAVRQKDKLAHIPSVMPINIKDFTMSSGYGVRRDPVYGSTKFHAGLDFAAKTGTPVFATADGIVVPSTAPLVILVAAHAHLGEVKRLGIQPSHVCGDKGTCQSFLRQDLQQFRAPLFCIIQITHVLFTFLSVVEPIPPFGRHLVRVILFPLILVLLVAISSDLESFVLLRRRL